MSKLIIKRAESYDSQTVYRAVKEIMLQQRINELIDETTTVLVKPNMLSRTTPEKAVTTHPVVVESVIMVLKEFGAKRSNITIADSSGGPSNSAILQGNYTACGFSLVAKTQGVNLYTKLVSKTVKTDGKIVKEFELIEPAVDSDIIINLAKFKTHVMTGMSGAVKNLFGTVPGLKKAEFHMRFPDKENFADMIVDLCETVKPDFTIIDAIMGMEGDGPAGGIPRNFGFLMAGKNPYEIDLTISYMMGFNPLALPIISAAINRGLVKDSFSEDMVTGDTILCKPIENFIKPNSYKVDFSDKVPRAIRWATPSVERILAPKPKINKSKCIGCGKCKSICPQHTIEIVNGKATINEKNCIRCFCCHEMCPAKAIDIKRSIFFNI